VVVHTLTYGSEIWAITERQETNNETAEIKSLRNVAGYTRNTKIREELNIINRNKKF
jgi:hypothetical protein